MAMIDMTVALTNPQTLQKFAVLRRKQFVNNFGETKMEIETIPRVFGVIHPEGPNDIARRPEAQTNAKTMVVITKFRLRGESENIDGVNYQPDVIQWGGNNFLVARPEDYSKYARGFIRATITSTDIVDRPPKIRQGQQ
jgi:hypothetical protein